MATTREYVASEEGLSAVVIEARGTSGQMHGYVDGTRDQTEPLVVVRRQVKQPYATSWQAGLHMHRRLKRGVTRIRGPYPSSTLFPRRLFVFFLLSCHRHPGAAARGVSSVAAYCCEQETCTASASDGFSDFHLQRSSGESCIRKRLK